MATPNYTKNCGIYIILNTKNQKVYIGKTEVSFHKRWLQHKRALNGAYHENEHLQRSWNKYGAKAFRFLVLEYCDPDELDDREKHHIAIYKARGLAYNMTVGGDGSIGYKHRPESLVKMSEAKRGKPLSPEHRIKISEANKGRKNPPVSLATRHKISEAGKGRIISEETRHKRSLSLKGKSAPNKGKSSSIETRAKISEALRNVSPDVIKRRADSNRGKKRSQATRHKISESQKGKTISVEQRRQISAALKGIPLSEETRRKMSESQKRRRVRETNK